MSLDNYLRLVRLGQKRHLRRQICAERERLYRIAWSWCHDTPLADDLVQETLTRALSKLDSLRNPARLSVWLTRIMANLHRDRYRRIIPETGLESERLVGIDDPQQSVNRDQLVSRTRAAIMQLSEDQRQVLTLIDLAGFSYADTAAIIDVPVGTIMSRLSRARRHMRKLLSQQGVERADVIPIGRPQ